MKALLIMRNLNPPIKVRIIFLLILIFPGCKKEDKETIPQPEPEIKTGRIEMIFVPEFGDAPLILNQTFNTPAGEEIKITNLKFFVSEIGLAKADNSENPAISDSSKHGVFLIDFSKPDFDAGYGKQSCKLSFQALPGEYRDLRFNIGLPRELNKADPTNAPYPLNLGQVDMYWSWNTGYIYLLVEGTGPEIADGFFHFGIGEEKRTMPFSFGNVFNPNPLVTIKEGKTTRILIKFNFKNILQNGDGSHYSLKSSSSANVHGGYYADLISANMASSMEFISAEIID